MILLRSSQDGMPKSARCFGGQVFRRSSHAGFTLVEILLALSILLSILLIILSSFTGAQRAREILLSKESALRQTRILLDRVGTDISGGFASAGNDLTGLSCKEDRFSDKSASTLQFTAFALPDASDVRPSGGIVRLRYSPRLSTDGNFIEIYREQFDIPQIENRVPNREARIAERILGFRVELYDGQKWVKEWPPDSARKLSMPTRAAFIVTDAQGTEYRRVVPIPLAGQEANVLWSGKRTKP